MASYARAIAVKPDFAEAFGNRGVVLEKLQRLDEALASYDRAIALTPDFAEAFGNQGVVLEKMQRLDEALASHERAMALNRISLRPSVTEARCSRKCSVSGRPWRGSTARLF